MDRFKLYLERFQKEILIGVIFIIFVVGGIAIYFFYKNDTSSQTFISSVPTQQEENKQEQEDVAKNQEEDQETIRVDIKGEVNSPGVYIAKDGMRVVDMIEIAGGLTKDADTSVNNLSRKIKDEMVIMIYSKKEVEKFSETKQKEEDILDRSQAIIEDLRNDGALNKEDILKNHPDTNNSDSSSNPGDNQTTQKISINTATKEELLSLSGIGESKAIAIIEYRKEHGNFTKIEDIMLVSGIGESVFAKIKGFITI